VTASLFEILLGWNTPCLRHCCHNPKGYDDIQVFVIWEFLGNNMPNVGGLCPTGTETSGWHIWIMQVTLVVFLRILSVSMPALPQQEGKGQHKTQTNLSCIKLTDMWYLDTYVSNLSRTNNNFWHWSTQDELKQAKFYGWH